MAGEELKSKVLNGQKHITIREGFRDYRRGPVLIGCHILDWCTKREIIDVYHCILGDTPISDLHADGFDALADAIEGLKKYYPDISASSPVTVIRWK